MGSADDTNAMQAANVDTDKGLVLVAGATGLVGRHVVKALLEKGYKVKVLLRNPAQAERYEGKAHVEAVQGNVAHAKTLAGVADGCRYVVSCLGYRWGDSDGANCVDALFKVYADGNRSLFNEASRAGVRQFILVSNCHSLRHQHDTLTFDAREEAVDYIIGKCKAAATRRAAREVSRQVREKQQQQQQESSVPDAKCAPGGIVAPSSDSKGHKQKGNTRQPQTGQQQQQEWEGGGGVGDGLPFTAYTVLDFAFSFDFLEEQMRRVAARGPEEGAWTAVGHDGLSRKVAPIAVADVADKVAEVVGDESAFNARQEVGGPETFTWAQVIALAFAALQRPVKLQVVPYWLYTLMWWWFCLLSMLGRPDHEARAQYMGWQRLCYKDDCAPQVAWGSARLQDQLQRAAGRWRTDAAKLRQRQHKLAGATGATGAAVGGGGGGGDGGGGGGGDEEGQRFLAMQDEELKKDK